MCGHGGFKTVALQTTPDTYLDLLGIDYSQMVRNIVKCENCGFVYRTPILDEAETARLYASPYRDHILENETADQYFDRIMAIPDDQSEIAAKLDWLEPRVGHDFMGCTVLDVGCGVGVFLAKVRTRWLNARVYGVEPCESFAVTTARRLKRPVFVGPYESHLFPRMDLITLLHVLEHVHDPLAMLREVVKDMAVDGIIYIETPSVKDFEVLPLEHDRFMSPHLYFFSLDSMRELCERAGLRVIESEYARTYRGKVDLRALCERKV